MSDNKTIIDFDEKRLRLDNVFSVPIIQYQTTNTEAIKKNFLIENTVKNLIHLYKNC